MKPSLIKQGIKPRVKYGSSEFEDAIYDHLMHYSLAALTKANFISFEKITQIVQQCKIVCSLAGVNSKHHFKQIYIYDELNGTLCCDWRMSEVGLKLLRIYTPYLNENMAKGMWKIATKN